MGCWLGGFCCHNKRFRNATLDYRRTSAELFNYTQTKSVAIRASSVRSGPTGYTLIRYFAINFKNP